MKVIWIATTCVLFFSMFVNSTEISLNHESDSLLETDADSVQADDHHHRIEKRSGSRPVPGYSEMKGDCGGHDIANVKATLQECAARCSGMGHCKGFLYVHQAQNYRWHRCWLKRRLCNNPRHPKGQVVSVYAKAGASAGSAHKTGKLREFPGYRGIIGFCRGPPFVFLKSTQEECAAQCTSRAECAGWAYLLNESPTYTNPRCFLKRTMCKPETVKVLSGSTVASYFKTKVSVKAAKPVTRVSEVIPQDKDVGDNEGIKENEEENDDNVTDAEAKSMKSKLEEVKKNPKDNIVLILIMVAVGLLLLFILRAFCMKKTEGPPPIPTTLKPPTSDED